MNRLSCANFISVLKRKFIKRLKHEIKCLQVYYCSGLRLKLENEKQNFPYIFLSSSYFLISHSNLPCIIYWR